MKKIKNAKTVSTTILCFIMAITLCACRKSVPSSSYLSITSQTTSSISYTDTKVENSSEEASAPTSSTDEKTESASNSSETTADETNNIPVSSEPITTTPTKTPDQIIVGKWRGSVDMAPMFLEQGYAVEGAQMVSCDIEFTSGGVIYETIDRVSLNAVYTAVLTKVLNDSLTENNLTKEQFEASIGKTYDEYLNELVQIAMELVPKTIINAYKFEGNDLYVREPNDADFEKEEYSFIDENKLTIVESGEVITYTRIV